MENWDDGMDGWMDALCYVMCIATCCLPCKYVLYSTCSAGRQVRIDPLYSATGQLLAINNEQIRDFAGLSGCPQHK